MTYSSDKGVIFFSSISSSAKFFWYFSQLEPVALGMLIDECVRKRRFRGPEVDADLNEGEWKVSSMKEWKCTLLSSEDVGDRW